jgi:hypothetical protein
MREAELRDQISSLLRDASIPFETGVSLGGVVPDFVVSGEDGRLIAVDVNTWDRKPGFTVRAAEKARLYQEAVGADGAVIMLDYLQRSMPGKGVVTVDGFLGGVQRALTKPLEGTGGAQVGSADRKIFVAMPFEGEYEDVYMFAMAHAAEAVGAACTRVDKEPFTGDIVTRIEREIRGSIAVIADLSEAKPNVMYEVGYAHALGRPCVHICRTPLAELPFDVRNLNTLAYGEGQIHLLRDQLAQRLEAVLAEAD